MSRILYIVMKTIIFFLTLLVSINTSTFRKQRLLHPASHVRHIIRATKSRFINMKTRYTMKAANKFGICPLIFARLGDVESDYRHYLINKKSGCMGVWQINPDIWRHLLWRVDNGRLGKHIQRKKITNVDRYWKSIFYNSEGAAMILSNYLKRFKGDYRKTLITFGGWAGYWGRRFPERRDDYVRRILGK